MPVTVDQAFFERLSQHTMKPGTLGEPQQQEFGFCAGRHVFDEEFSALNNAFGDAVLLGMRIDTNKVPAEIKRAYRAMAERVYMEDSATGFLSRRERMAAKEDAEERCRQELAEGRYRRSKMVDVLWDTKSGTVLAPAFSDAVVGGLRDLFLAAFDVRLQPLSSGTLAYEVLSAQGRTRCMGGSRDALHVEHLAGKEIDAAEQDQRERIAMFLDHGFDCRLIYGRAALRWRHLYQCIAVVDASGAKV